MPPSFRTDKKTKDWDSGYITPYYTPEPIVVNDHIYLYYAAHNARHWWTWSGDPPKKEPDAKDPTRGVGLATMRLDGFVSIDAGADGGSMLTRPFVFLGDAIELNADATGGSIEFEALDPDGKTIEGFARDRCVPVASDNVHHHLSWQGHKDLHLLQARPIRLRFYLKNAKLFSLTPRTLNRHYIQSYD